MLTSEEASASRYKDVVTSKVFIIHKMLMILFQHLLTVDKFFVFSTRIFNILYLQTSLNCWSLSHSKLTQLQFKLKVSKGTNNVEKLYKMMLYASYLYLFEWWMRSVWTSYSLMKNWKVIINCHSKWGSSSVFKPGPSIYISVCNDKYLPKVLKSVLYIASAGSHDTAAM